MIIFLPEYMGKEGNFLLKTLEEPPQDTLFLLLAENEEKILPTILSRTQVLRIPLLSDKQISEALSDRLDLNTEDASRIAFLANGDFIQAIKLSENAENNYTEEFINWMRACLKPDMSFILKWVDELAGSGRENQKNFLIYSLNLLRESYLTKLNLRGLTRLLNSEKEFIEKFSPFIGESNIKEFEEAFSKVHFHIERNGNPKILFFNLSLFINELLQRQRLKA